MKKNSVISTRLLTVAHTSLVINVYSMECLGEMLKRVLFPVKGGIYLALRLFEVL